MLIEEIATMPFSDEGPDEPNFSASRRELLKLSGTVAGLATAALPLAAASAQATSPIILPRLHAASEKDDEMPPAADSRSHRIGYAIVGLGDLAIKQILPAFGRTQHARIAALVSGNVDKARTLAIEYDVDRKAIYDYDSFDRLIHQKDVDAVYIVLTNSLHAEFTIRAAAAGKHVLCEKPMATSAEDCRRMIAACDDAGRKLMIAYRSQYEPTNRLLLKTVRSGRLGMLKTFISSNSQNEGRVDQWRLKRAMAGGGPLVDVGIYCLNAARFISGEEPVEVYGRVIENRSDPRFAEVEEAVQFDLRFPSGLIASCASSYAAHKSQFLRVEGTEAFAELNPAYAYHGQKLRLSQLLDGHETVVEPQSTDKDQFALELDHFAQCIRNDIRPHTPGEEGLQDQVLMEAIYASAASRQPIAVTSPTSTRGPDPVDAA